ncbi:hypothetical protein CV102_15230 [Natronococcus pandeyae]|uniref:Pilin/flagellin n=1 Tax=Natronococcus pandeyae TaxID=2055836 RepID=A0A8J8TPR0_9EURY|nr:hypothetical protein [Natronococcus pandeyae]TYL37688.1 hypothetical protein CV102_15230 [Natronococcus pandeyae]
MRRKNRSPDRGRKRTCGQRPRTISVSLSDRGQTTQDFAIGIGVFLLSIAFVFSYIPSLTTPFDSPAGGAETAQADRIADRLVHSLSDSADRNEIDGERFVATYANDDEDENVTALGLRATDDAVFDHVSVRLETLDGNETEHDGTAMAAETTAYDDQSAASSARIVTLDDEFDLDDYDDEPAYRLVVRVW